MTLVVQVPTKLSQEAKEALIQFDAACGNRPQEDEDGKGRKKEKGLYGQSKGKRLRINPQMLPFFSFGLHSSHFRV